MLVSLQLLPLFRWKIFPGYGNVHDEILFFSMSGRTVPCVGYVQSYGHRTLSLLYLSCRSSGRVMHDAPGALLNIHIPSFSASSFFSSFILSLAPITQKLSTPTISLD